MRLPSGLALAFLALSAPFPSLIHAPGCGGGAVIWHLRIGLVHQFPRKLRSSARVRADCPVWSERTLRGRHLQLQLEPPRHSQFHGGVTEWLG